MDDHNCRYGVLTSLPGYTVKHPSLPQANDLFRPLRVILAFCLRQIHYQELVNPQMNVIVDEARKLARQTASLETSEYMEKRFVITRPII